MTKTTKTVAANASRENNKATDKARAIATSAKAQSALSTVETGAFDFAKGQAALVAAIKAALAAKVGESLIRDAAMTGAIFYRLTVSAGTLTDDARAALHSTAARVLSLKAAHLGNTDEYRSADQQRAYDAAKKIWQRAYAEAKGEPKKARKPQPAKAATAGDKASPVTGETKGETPAPAPLAFAEYVKTPPRAGTMRDAADFARNMAALMHNYQAKNAAKVPLEIVNAFTAFEQAIKALPEYKAK